jgi:hypothetical protein
METRLRVGGGMRLEGPSRLLTAPAQTEEQARAATFAPYAHSLPSSFQRAKPRVYRSAFTADAARPRQTKCAVITTSGSDDAGFDDDWIPPDGAEEDRAGTAADAGRPRLGPTKAAIVALEELDDGTTFLLDFRAGQRPRKAVRSAASRSGDTRAAKHSDWDAHFLSWEGLSERQRRLELMAAAKSRAIRQLAEAEGVQVPQVHEFEPSEHTKPNLGVNAFTRWFLASRMHRQRVREVFLLEELTFAARDLVIHQQLATRGRSAPLTDQVGVSSSLAWREFVTWYALGRSAVVQTHAGDQLLLRERLEERADYLEHRLGVVAATEAELDLRAREAADDPTELQSTPAVFVFENAVMERSAALDDPMSWENTNQANRQKEVALALLDPQVQVAAMKSEIELPDLSSASLEDFDIFSLAGKFLPWWKSSSNQHRKAFLDREVSEASRDAAIVELLRQSQQQAEDGGNTVDAAATLEHFIQQYFKSDSTRHAFLKKKLFFLKRRSRVASVAKYGKLPTPLLYALLPVPVISPFCFRRPDPVQEETASPDEASAVDGSTSVTDAANAEQQRDVEAAQQLVSDEDEQERRQLEEAARLRSESEIDLMTAEDELSRAFGACMEEESDDEMDSAAMVKPKRSDFSRSYFFGSLPVHFRFISSSGWGGAGSGVDNGDEEIEEEERLEQERERQRLLDQQEAERILEAERQAERLRIEKEKEEKAMQARRMRTTELKKVLLHQAELEAQRRLELEFQRVEDEQRRMAQEELAQQQLLAQLEDDRRGMEHEDAVAQTERQAIRAAAAQKMKRMLLEITEMTAEDERSRRTMRELRRRELEEEEHRQYLAELYSTFEPFFPSSKLPSEDFLPSIQRRLMNQRQLQALQRPSQSPYTVPFAEAVALEDVEPEPYLARDSRKFALLMGLPVRRSRQQKRSRIPSEEAIIQLQQQKNLFPLEDEGRESVSAPPTLLSHKQARRQQERRPRQLPELPRGKVDDILSDLSEPGQTGQARASTTSQNQRMHHRHELQHPPSLMPFFRGNMIVRGHSQGRARDYSYS